MAWDGIKRFAAARSVHGLCGCEFAFCPVSAACARGIVAGRAKFWRQALRQRITGLGASEALAVLNYEMLFYETGAVLNLTDPVWQVAVTRYCMNNGFKLLVLDNLSCLFSGVKENDADAWETALPWLLELRRHRIAVLFVAHSGRDGKNMRGTSRREDAAF